jgi:hypothetical protein
LYILIASLLVEQMQEYHERRGGLTPRPASISGWQLQSILKILKSRHDHEGWHRTFVANRPIYTAGIFASTPEVKDFIQEAMQRRWRRCSIYMASRYKDDLERSWCEDQDMLPGTSPSVITDIGSERNACITTI